MKPMLPIAAVLLFFSSCSPFQYLTLDAGSTVKDNEKNIVWENDSIKLVYHFSYPAKLDIRAFNKTGGPVYINWKKSAIIQDGRSFTLYEPGVQVTGSVVKDANYPGALSQTSTLNASFSIPEGMDFMPPKTYISRTGINVFPVLPGLSKLGEEVPAQKMKDADGNKLSYRAKKYDATASPLKFRVYLTLGIGNDSKEFAIEHLFFVSELVETANGSQAIFIKEAEGDKLYGRVSSL